MSETISGEEIEKIVLSEERVEIHMKNGEIIVVQPTYSWELKLCRPGDDDCYRRVIYLEMLLE